MRHLSEVEPSPYYSPVNGEEYDAESSYRINRQLELGTGIAHIFPGAFLVNTHHNHAYTYPYLMLNYNLF